MICASRALKHGVSDSRVLTTPVCYHNRLYLDCNPQPSKFKHQKKLVCFIQPRKRSLYIIQWWDVLTLRSVCISHCSLQNKSKIFPCHRQLPLDMSPLYAHGTRPGMVICAWNSTCLSTCHHLEAAATAICACLRTQRDYTRLPLDSSRLNTLASQPVTAV